MYQAQNSDSFYRQSFKDTKQFLLDLSEQCPRFRAVGINEQTAQVVRRDKEAFKVRILQPSSMFITDF